MTETEAETLRRRCDEAAPRACPASWTDGDTNVDRPPTRDKQWARLFAYHEGMDFQTIHSSSGVALEEAGRSLLGAVASGGCWIVSLESLMTHWGCLGGTLSCIMPPRRFGVLPGSLKETFEAIASGKTPPMSEATMMTPTAQDGVVCDQRKIYLHGTGRKVVNLLIYRGRSS